MFTYYGVGISTSLSVKGGAFFWKTKYNTYIELAEVAKLVDAQVLGTCGVTLGGSSPLLGT